MAILAMTSMYKIHVDYFSVDYIDPRGHLFLSSSFWKPISKPKGLTLKYAVFRIILEELSKIDVTFVTFHSSKK